MVHQSPPPITGEIIIVGPENTHSHGEHEWKSIITSVDDGTDACLMQYISKPPNSQN